MVRYSSSSSQYLQNILKKYSESDHNHTTEYIRITQTNNTDVGTYFPRISSSAIIAPNPAKRV